ncbi:MAG: ABC transporter permease [Acidimicrobiales bacterium]
MTVPAYLRPLSYFWLQFRRTWKADVSTTFLTPLLFLASIGAGLGALVGHGRPMASLGGETYLSFLAPALLATTAMQVAILRATYEVWGCCNPWSGAYRSMQASPIAIEGIVAGQLAWIVARVLLASAFYLAVSAAFGTVRSPAAAGDLLVGPLVGLAFAAPIAAYSVGARHDQPFSVILRLVMMPLFLFSGTFFPVSQLPAALQWLAYCLPLWHGIELSRDLYAGHVQALADGGHVAYLVAVGAAGVFAARVTFKKKLAH